LEEISLALATALFAGHFAAEPLLRRGRAKSLATTPFERKSTLLVTAVGLASVVASFAARFGLEWGRLAPHPGRVSVLGLVMLAGVALRYCYLAQLVVLTAGCALASLNVWLPALIGPLLLAAYVYRIQAEERMLASEFGETYQRYRSRTWRLIPGVY
jgi:protein-S-isoprenylcysteine O-methyltransferase Ste14